MNNQGVAEAERVKRLVKQRIQQLRAAEQQAQQAERSAEQEEQRLKRHGLGGALKGAAGLMKSAFKVKQRIKELDKIEAKMQHKAQDADREADLLEKHLFTLDFWVKRARSGQQSDVDEAVRHAHEIERGLW